MIRPISFLLLAAFPTLLAAQESPAFSSCPCTLRGTVVNSVTGAPVPGALVQSSSASQPAMLTDSDGAFHFDSLPAGALSVSATKPGFLPQNPFLRQSTSIAVGPDAPPAIIKITPGGVITGRVVDEQGEPLENFTIRLIRRAPSLGTLYLFNFNAKTYATNDLGIFRVPDLNPGSYFALISPPSKQTFQSSSNNVPLMYPSLYYPGVLDTASATAVKVTAGHESRADFTVSAKPAIRFSGTITGIPPGAKTGMTLRESFQVPALAVGPSLSFDPSTGNFQTAWLAPGTYSLSAVSTDAGATEANWREAQHSAEISITASASLSGIHLMLNSNVSIPIEMHGLSQPEDTRYVSIGAYTLETGYGGQASPRRSPLAPFGFLPYSYELDLYPGTYHLQISPYMTEPYYVDSATLGSTNLLAGEFTVDSSTARSSIDIVLRKGAATLSGTVNMKDASRGALICLFPPSPRAPAFSSADLNGSFRLDHLAPGAYRAVAVDGLIDPNPANPELLKKLSSAAKEFSLSPEQALSLELEITEVQD